MSRQDGVVYIGQVQHFSGDEGHGFSVTQSHWTLEGAKREAEKMVRAGLFGDPMPECRWWDARGVISSYDDTAGRLRARIYHQRPGE